MEFRFSIDENVPPPPSGYDLGHVDVSGSLGEATSRGGARDRAMMIYLSLTLLLDGLRRFLSGRDRSYTSAAVDSSFSLTFKRSKGGLIETTHEGDLVDRSTPREVAAAVYTGAREFAADNLPQLPVDDAGREDLEQSLTEFERYLARA